MNSDQNAEFIAAKACHYIFMAAYRALDMPGQHREQLVARIVAKEKLCVGDRVATVVRRLPRDVDPPVVSKFDNDSSPVLTIAVSADRPLRELATSVGSWSTYRTTVDVNQTVGKSAAVRANAVWQDGRGWRESARQQHTGLVGHASVQRP